MKAKSDTAIAKAATEAALREMFGRDWRRTHGSESRFLFADMHRALKAGLRVMLREISRGRL